MSDQVPHPPLPESAEGRVYELCLGGGDVSLGLRDLQARYPEHAAALAALVRDLQRADSVVSGVHKAATARDLPLAPGAAVGNYRIVRELGRGGFGVVYLAEQSEPVRREVALKLVSPESASADMLQRFAAERQVLAQLSHPAIARVLDAGTTAAGQPFFAMDYLPGEPIVTFADRRKLDVDARLRLFLEVCGAVQHAHQRGVLHRDLKPGNLLVAERDGVPWPCVIDFGLAKVLHPSAALGAAGTTELGRLLGTPEYMSPEQASGEAVDTRTDLYSLGVILFELLVGELPFASTRLRARGLGSVVQILTMEEAPLASVTLAQSPRKVRSADDRATGPRDLLRRLRGDLDLILCTCLHKDREQRYGSVADLAADVRRHLAHQPISVARSGWGYVALKFARRHRMVVAAAAVAVLAITMGVSAVVWGLVNVTSARDAAVLAADAAKSNAYAASIAAAQSAGEACRAEVMRMHLANTAPELRNIEWRHLQAQTEDAEVVLPAGIANPHCLVVGEGFALWASIYQNQFRRISLESGAEATVHEWPWQVASSALSQDGKLLAVGGVSGQVRVCAVDTWTTQLDVRIGKREVRGICLSSDGARLLAADDRDIVLIDVATGDFRGRLRGHESFCWSVDIDRSGERAASGDANGAVRIWSLATRQCERVLQHPGIVRQVLFHPDGQRLATASRDGVIRLWSTRDGQLLGSQTTGAAIVHGLAFAPDGSVLTSAQSDGSVRFWDGATLLDLGSGRGHAAYVSGVGYRQDGRPVTCAWDGTLRIWPVRPRARARALTGMIGNTMRLELHPHEPWIAACSLGGEVAVWNYESGEKLFVRNLSSGMCHGLAFSADGARLFVTSDAGGITVLAPASGEVLQRVPTKRLRLRDLQLRPGRDQLIVGSANGEVVVVDTVQFAPLHRMAPNLGEPVRNALRTVVDPRGELIVSCDPEVALRAFSIEPSRELWQRTDLQFLDAGFAPSGELYVSDTLGFVRQLDPKTGAEIRHFGRGTAHQPVSHLQVTPDGARLVTTDQRVRIWDLKVGRELLAFDTDRYEPGAVLAAPERGVLAAGGGYFTDPSELLLWPLSEVPREHPK